MKTITSLNSPERTPLVPKLSQPNPVEPQSAPPSVIAPPSFTPAQQSITSPQPQPGKLSLGTNDDVPVGVAASSLGLSGKFNTRLPKGVYVIVGLVFIDFLSIFFNTNTSSIYSIAMVLDLLVAVGLLTKTEMARKAAVYVEIISIVLICIVVIMLASLDAKVNKSEAQFKQVVASLNTATETDAQKTGLAKLSTLLDQERKQLGHDINIAYIRDGISAAFSIGILVYLTRPSVKEVFHS
jgi:ABC-type multidrug transport system fused ATPase/permease subunit